MGNQQYKIAYATGSRADYGIVRNYLTYLNNDKDIDFSVLVTGSHMDERFGKTVSIIEDDGFKIDLKVDLQIDTKSTSAILNSMSIAIKEFGCYFEEHKYDLLIILGDRYEMMAVAQAAAMQRIPILHLHGGEVTYGNYDEFIRHCITKMSRYHFASTEVYKNRIIQMGENPETVFNMGALGAENCTKINEDAVIEDVKYLPLKQYFVVAFHPETLTNIDLAEQVEIVINSIKTMLGKFEIVLIGTNADTKSEVIRNRWIDFAKQKGVHYFESLNADSYLYLVKNSVCLVGNSSSGIIEAPSLGAYSINIGDRQKGRIHGDTVIDVVCDKESISSAIKGVTRCISQNISFVNPYYQPDAAKRYYSKTKELLIVENTAPKEFFDCCNVTIEMKM